jgi:predicted RNA-binding Zn-ribbon protein involved in translation (DUF1610 family)
LSEDMIRNQGFEIFKNGRTRRLSPTHYVIKAPTASGWQLVELKNGKWTCDCGNGEFCVHLYAAQLHRSTSKLQPENVDKTHLKCRHCGSLDIARCGFRYNARGIARRYKCNDCQRKFCIAHIQRGLDGWPSETVWLLNEIGMLTSKLTELVAHLNEIMESPARPSVNGDENANQTSIQST